MDPIGKSFEEIETPALLLDLDNFQWNIDKMFKWAKEKGVNVRPHAKTFKAAAICNKLLEAGAIGLMTQKLGEAEALLHAGLLYGDKNILISQEISDPAKTEKLVGMNVAMGEGKVMNAIENVEEAERLSRAALKWGIKQHVVIEMSQGRCGTPPGRPTVDLAKKVVSLKGLKFRGIYGYEGPVDKGVALPRNKLTVDTANMIREAGMEVEIVSAASTGTFEVTGKYSGITEIEPGSFVFGVGPEGTGYGWGTYNEVYFKPSLTVLTQIIGANYTDRVVTDAGLKVMSAGWYIASHYDKDNANKPVLIKVNGELVDFESVSLSEEHGTVQFKEGNETRKKLKWGDKIEFVPSHCCTTLAQHEKIYVVKGGKLAAVWPITAKFKYY